MSTIHVGIITYDNTIAQVEKLGRSLDRAIARADLAPGAVALSVIDNGAPTKWPVLATPIRFWQAFDNIGFAAAANQLLRTLREDGGEVLILANPDGAFHPDCLKALLAKHAQHPADLIEAKQFPEEHPKSYDAVTGRTGWCSGACLLVPRGTAEAIGGFDERFFLYMEDVDFSWRAREAGFAARIAPRALFMHDVLGRSPPRKVLEWNLLSQRWFGWKWHDALLVAQTEHELVQQGFLHAIADLPPLPAERPPLSDRGWRIRDFTDRAAFGPRRW